MADAESAPSMAAPEDPEAWLKIVLKYFPEENLATGGGSQAQSAGDASGPGKQKRRRRKRFIPDADRGKKDNWLTNRVKASKSIHQEAKLQAKLASMKIDRWADAPWPGLLYDKPNFAAMVGLREEYLKKLAEEQGWGWVPTVDPDTGVPLRGKKLSNSPGKDYPEEYIDNDRLQSEVSHNRSAGPHKKSVVGVGGYIPYDLLHHPV